MNQPSVWVTPAKTDRASAIEFGRRNAVATSLAAGARVTVIDNTQFEGLPQPISVHLFKSDPGTNPSPDFAGEARALIRYGCGASSNEVRCDWRGQFSIVCSSLSIDLENTIGNGDLATVIRDVKYGAHLGIGAIANPNLATYTTETTSLGIGEPSPLSVAIPQFAVRYFPVLARPTIEPTGGAPLLTADLRNIFVNFEWPDQTYQSSQRLTVDALRNGIWIPADAVRVAITWHFLLDFYRMRHRFDLAL